MIIISAMSKDRVIGSGDGMPWNVPDEYEHFLHTVRNATVIMGRKSYEIFGDDLDNQTAIMVTRGNDQDGVRTAASLEAAYQMALSDDREVFIAGGGSIYAQALPIAERMYLSVIPGEFTGDVYFPEFDPLDWRLERHEDRGNYQFFDYVRCS